MTIQDPAGRLLPKRHLRGAVFFVILGVRVANEIFVVTQGVDSGKIRVIGGFCFPQIIQFFFLSVVFFCQFSRVCIKMRC